MMDVLLGIQSAGPSDTTASTPQQGGQVYHGGGGHHHRHHDVSDQSSGADPLDQIMDADAGTGTDTDTDALADLMGQDSDAANPADFMAAIQAYQQNAGPMQSTA
jgi:hypothetical protein